MVSCVRSVVTLGIVVLALVSNPTLANDNNSKKSPLNQLDNSDLLDLLDADLDEAFLMKSVRDLQEMTTMSPTPAPSAADRGIDDVSSAPTGAPTMSATEGGTPTNGDRGIETRAPVGAPTDEASGAMVWRPASAAMAVAAVVLAATAVMA